MSEFLKSSIKLAIIASELQDDIGPTRLGIQKSIANIIRQKFTELNFEQTCLVAGALGMDNIDNDLSIDLQNHVFSTLKQGSVEETELFILGFYSSYLVDRDLYKFLRPKILSMCDEFELHTLLKLVRSLYVLDFEEEEEVHQLAEGRVLGIIKEDLASLTIGDFYQIFFTFHMTRKASRELYRLSEYVFMMRLPEFNKEIGYL